MSAKSSISIAETHQFLQQKWGAGVDDVAPIGAGAWSYAFAFTYDGGRYVIRWSFVRENFERDAVAATFSRADMPVPPTLELGSGPGGYYAISPFFPGGYLEALTSSDLERALPAILRMFTELRRIDCSRGAGFGDWGTDQYGEHPTWRSFLRSVNVDRPGRLTAGWQANLRQSPLDPARFERVYARFGTLVDACPEDRYMVHSDLLNRNVLVAGDRISAVLDWGSSFFGDTLYDVAWFHFYEPWYPEFGRLGVARRLLDHFQADPATNKTNVAERLLAYQLHIGLDSIAYNAFQRDWESLLEVADYVEGLG